jgi:hypothetical protein
MSGNKNWMSNYGFKREFSLLLVFSWGILIIVKWKAQKRQQKQNKKPNKLFSVSLLRPEVVLSSKRKKKKKARTARKAANKNSFRWEAETEAGESEAESECKREEEKSCEDKKAVYFMITTLTYANKVDIMKGMMNIKHIKIKISIWITTTSCAWKKEWKTRERKYIGWSKILPLIFYIITWFLCIKRRLGEMREEDTLNFYFLLLALFM